MKPFLRTALLIPTLLLSGAAWAHGSDSDVDAKLQQFAQGEHRSEKNIARNQYRNPAQTLSFFGIHPDMTVIELWPGGGWYSEIIAPYLKDNGQFVAANFDTSDKQTVNFYKNAGKRYLQKVKDNPEIYGNTKVINFDPSLSPDLGVEASADMVLTFRNLHNWAMKGKMETVFQSAFEVLTPGGVFGVVEHRGTAEMPAESGYMDEAEVIALAKKVGFKLAAKSEINANPKDTKDYERGVWTLPPSLRLKEKDREKYLAIGESDRMTLKFYKPEI